MWVGGRADQLQHEIITLTITLQYKYYTRPLAFADTFRTPPVAVLDVETERGVPISRDDLRRGEALADAILLAIARPTPMLPYEEDDRRLVGVDTASSSSGMFSEFSETLTVLAALRLAMRGGFETVLLGEGAFLGCPGVGAGKVSAFSPFSWTFASVVFS